MENTTTIKDIEDLISVINRFLNSNPRYSFHVQNYRKDNVTSREVTIDNEILKQIATNNISLLLKNCEKKKELHPYPYGSCKSDIEYRSIHHESLDAIMKKLIQAIGFPSISFDEKVDEAFQTYTLKLSLNSDEYIIFMTKKNNPMYNLKRKSILFLPVGNSLVKAPDKLFQITSSIDAIIYKDNIYFITLNLEKTLGLETYAKMQKEKCISSFKKALSPNEFNALYPFLKSTNANTFNNIIDDRIILLSAPNKKQIIAKKLHIPMNNNELNLSAPIAQKALLSYCQNKIAINIDNIKENVYSPVPYQTLPIKAHSDNANQ